MGVLDILSQGFRGAGAAMSQGVYDTQRQEEQQQLTRTAQNDQLMMGVLIKAVESGAAPPTVLQKFMTAKGIQGAPAIGPNMDVQREQERSALDKNAATAVEPFMNQPKPDIEGAMNALSKIPGGLGHSMMGNLQKMREKPDAYHFEKDENGNVVAINKADPTKKVDTGVKGPESASQWAEVVGPDNKVQFVHKLTGEIRKTAAESRSPSLVNVYPGGIEKAINPKTGEPEFVQVPKDGGKPKFTGLKPVPPASETKEGSRNEVFTNRITTSANEAMLSLRNIVQLPVTASRGYFGGRTQGSGLLDASKETLTNRMTSEEVQVYNVMAAGIQRNLASIEAVGLMPSGSLTHQMDAVVIKDGDTSLTKAAKLAEIRQIIEGGLEPILNNPRVEKEKKDFIKTIIDNVRKAVPFQQADVIKMMGSKNGKTSLGSIIKGQKRDESSGAITKPYTGDSGNSDVQDLLDKYPGK